MTLAKKFPARLAEFTLLLAFVGLTSLPGFAQERAAQPHIGLVHDWSHRHIVFTDTNDVQTRLKQGSDLRARSSWARRTRVAQPNTSGRALVAHQSVATINKKKKGGGGSGGAISGVSVDWALPLGKGAGANIANYGGLAAGAYPAKYNFDINAAPDCTNDYIAMGLNTPGAAGYPNIVGINNLYSNSGSSGFCSGSGPAAYFAYYTAAANPTSVVVSLDGTKIAWVENAATPVFHVLAWKASDGTLAAPVQLSLHGVAAAPVAGSGTMTSLTLASAVNDTNSSPYVDYATDTAYVGSDNGRLYKITNVFCQTIASPAANSTCANAQPAFDGTWGGTGVSVAATTGLTSPVVDTYLATPLVFVAGSSGTSKGSVFARKAADGTAPTTPSITPGRAASANGGVVDPPVIDVTNSKLYVTAGCDSATNGAVAVQNPYTSAGFGTSVATNIGGNAAGTACPSTNMHAGTPDDAYITAIQSSSTTFSGNMIFCGTVRSGTGNWQAMLYKFPVTDGVMSATAAARSGNLLTDGMGAAADAECSAVTDVSNSNFASGPTERIYMGLGGTTDGHLRSFDGTFTTPAASVSRNVSSWSNLNGVITMNTTVALGVAPGNYVTVAATTAGTCNNNGRGTFEVLTASATQITFNNPAVTTSPCTGTAATGTAIGDSTIQSVSTVDVTTPLALQAVSGIIIDNVAATGSFAEASNIYFTQLGAGNIAGGSCPATATITTATRDSGTVTITTSAAHGLAVGDTVTIAGVSTGGTISFDGVFSVTSVNVPPGNTFTYALGGTAPGTGGSVFANACFYKLSQLGLQ
ncbi:MAG: hypothetical protein ABSG52_01580 [Terriglobales bacterium]